jgi:multiple sugar transport system substrate-binding protein
MTGLERLVRIHSGSHRVLRRYLTLFYGITLGLAFVLLFSACDRKEALKPISVTVTQGTVLARTASPAPGSTQGNRNNTPTSLPAIPPTPNERTPSTQGVTMAELRGLQVNLWHPWTGATGAGLQAILDEFNRTNKWGITVQASAYEGFGGLDEEVEAALTAKSADSLPDVLVDYGYQARHWDGNGVITDLMPYINDPVWGLTSDEQADFYPGFWAEDLVTVSGMRQTRRLGIPFYRSAYVLFYNQSWARELGYPDPPTTPEGFRVQACAAAESVARQGDKSSLSKGGWLITSQPGALIGWIYAFGGEIINPVSTGYRFNTAETRQAFEYLKGLQESGCAWSTNGAEAQNEFANRRALFVVGSMFDIPAQREAFARSTNSDEWMVIPFPSSNQPVVDTYGPSLLVTRSTPAQQLAGWLLIEWLVYPPNQAVWVKELETYPTRQSTLSYLSEAAATSPQLAEALNLLPEAHSEPSLASWSVVRWTLEDAAAQLFNLQFSADQIPSLLENLDSVAAEIFGQVR